MQDRWPTLLAPPTSTGTIREQPEDFQVEELPAYLPSSQGDHLMLLISKRERTTEEVARALARHLSVPVGQVGYAGLKDRRAVALQWFSVPASKARLAESFESEGVSVLRSGLHGNKLKTGHLKGNRFKILVRNLGQNDYDEIARRGEEIATWGVPNYFGAQRFGAGGTNEEQGKALLTGRQKIRDRRQLRFLLSAVQAGMFNDVLALRIRRGLFTRVLEGDVLTKADTGGMFLCTDPEADQVRVDNLKVHPTGPMFGKKMKAPKGEPAAMEQEVLEASGLTTEDFSRFPKLTRGTRRSLRLVPWDFDTSAESDGLVLYFNLPPGGYATSVLRELIVQVT